MSSKLVHLLCPPNTLNRPAELQKPRGVTRTSHELTLKLNKHQQHTSKADYKDI